MGIKVEGLKELERKFSNLQRKSKVGIEKAMQLIYQESQPGVPVDTGRLKRSGAIIDNGDSMTIIYHAENPNNKYNYAPIQHENLYFKHRVGHAKYLEAPIHRNYETIKKIIIDEVLK